MALTACPECDAQISNKASKCPKCGFEMKKKKKKAGGKFIIIALLVIMGIGVSVAVIGLDKSMYMVGLTPSIKSQVIGTWQADEGYSISFTSDTYTGKDGVSRPYRWQEETIQTRTLGSLFIRAGNVEIDDDQAQVKRVVRVVMGANGTTLMINVGEQSFQYRKVGVSGAGPSVDHPQTAPSEPVPAKKTDTSKNVSAPAKEVDLSKIIAVTKSSALTELQKETQFEDFSGFIAVTGKIESSMRSPVNKSHLQIFICPLDSDINLTRKIRCDVSAFSKEVMAAAPGTPVTITGNGKYAPGLLEFVMSDSKAELADAQIPKKSAGDPASAGGAGAEPKDPIQSARAKGHEIGVKMVANQNAAKQLMSDVANAARQNDTSQARSLQRQLESLQRTKAQIDTEGLDYAKTLNQAERDAFLEGVKSAQAEK